MGKAAEKRNIEFEKSRLSRLLSEISPQTEEQKKRVVAKIYPLYKYNPGKIKPETKEIIEYCLERYIK